LHFTRPFGAQRQLQKIALRHVAGFRCTFSTSNPANRVFFLQGASK
jgi:hypothetical protein